MLIPAKAKRKKSKTREIFVWLIDLKDIYCQIHGKKAPIKNGHLEIKWKEVITNDDSIECMHDLYYSHISELRDQMPSAWTIMILVQSSKAQGVSLLHGLHPCYTQSNMPYILSSIPCWHSNSGPPPQI